MPGFVTFSLFLFCVINRGSAWANTRQLSPLFGSSTVSAEAGSVHGCERDSRKATLDLPDRSLLRSWQGFSPRAALCGHQSLGVSKPPLGRNFPTSSQPKKFPSEKSILAYIMSFSQQLLRPSTDVLRFLRKRRSQKAAGGVSLWSQCPASAAEEFTALLALTLYVSPQPCDSSRFVSRDVERESRARSVPRSLLFFRVSHPWARLCLRPARALRGRGCPGEQRGAAIGTNQPHPRATDPGTGALKAPTPSQDNMHFCIARKQMYLNHHTLHPLKILNTVSFI